MQEFDVTFNGKFFVRKCARASSIMSCSESSEGGATPVLSRYQNDLRMVQEFVNELNQEQLMVVAMRNVPNTLFESVDWTQLDDLQQKLIQLGRQEN